MYEIIFFSNWIYFTIEVNDLFKLFWDYIYIYYYSVFNKNNGNKKLLSSKRIFISRKNYKKSKDTILNKYMFLRYIN